LWNKKNSGIHCFAPKLLYWCCSMRLRVVMRGDPASECGFSYKSWTEGRIRNITGDLYMPEAFVWTVCMLKFTAVRICKDFLTGCFRQSWPGIFDEIANDFNEKGTRELPRILLIINIPLLLKHHSFRISSQWLSICYSSILWSGGYDGLVILKTERPKEYVHDFIRHEIFATVKINMNVRFEVFTAVTMK
jgi:hypothetical protein